MFIVTKAGTKNCYHHCPGIINEVLCSPIIFFNEINSTVSTTLHTRNFFLSGMDNYILGLHEATTKIIGSDFIMYTFLSNTTQDYRTFSLSQCESKLMNRYDLSGPFLFAKIESTSDPSDADYKVYTIDGNPLDINVCTLTIRCTNSTYNGYYQSSHFTLSVSEQNLAEEVKRGTKTKFLFPLNLDGKFVVDYGSMFSTILVFINKELTI